MNHLRCDPPPARDREGRRPRRTPSARCASKSHADANKTQIKAGGREAVQGEGGRSSDRDLRGQAAAARPLRRLPLGLEEGLREAEGGRERCRSTRRSKTDADQDLSDRLRRRAAFRPWSRATTSPSRRPKRSLVEGKKRTGGRNSTGPRHVALHRRRAQAGLPRSSISSATRRAFRRWSRPSNTIRTARRASRC